MQSILLSLMSGLLLSVTACGDDPASKPAPEKDAGDDSANTSTAGTSSGSSGTGGSTELMCGKDECVAPALGGGDGGTADIASMLSAFGGFADGLLPVACCTGPKEDKCGVTQSMFLTSCVEQNQEGKPDTTCPDEEQTLGGILPLKFTGCCRPDNKCGVNVDIIGVGCLERTQASKIVMMTGVTADGGVPALTSKSCDYVGTTGNDAGSDDAGSTN